MLLLGPEPGSWPHSQARFCPRGPISEIRSSKKNSLSSVLCVATLGKEQTERSCDTPPPPPPWSIFRALAWGLGLTEAERFGSRPWRQTLQPTSASEVQESTLPNPPLILVPWPTALCWLWWPVSKKSSVSPNHDRAIKTPEEGQQEAVEHIEVHEIDLMNNWERKCSE